MPIPRLRDWKPGDSIRESRHHQETVNAIRRLSNQVDGLRVGGDGLVFLSAFPAKVVDKGPDDAADYGDSRYWCTRLIVEGARYEGVLNLATDTSQDAAGESPGLDLSAPNTITAVNLAEYFADSHSLDVSGSEYVWVVVVVDRGDPPTKHFLFYARPAETITLTITALLTGGSKYTVQRLPPAGTDVDDTSDAVLADLGTADGTDAIGIDTNELGRAGHSHLDSVGDVVEGRLLRVNGDGVRVYTFAAAPVAAVWFAVDLSQAAGSNGNKTTAASYTYDVTAKNGETLASALTPINDRPNGTATAATAGQAYYTAAGTLFVEAYEKYGTGWCP
jgi:hypothetical protein